MTSEACFLALISKDKVILITSITSGIGRFIMVRFAQEDSKVAIHYQKAESGVGEIEALAHQA